MLGQLQRHPIPMQAHFDDVLVLTYAAEPTLVETLIPPGLTLDTYEGHAMLAVAVVQTRRMRPVGVPAWLGQDFVLAGFRVFVRFRDETGRTRRGLRIVRSYTDRRRMVLGGNLLTHYNYALCDAAIDHEPHRLRVRMTSGDGRGDLDATAYLGGDDAPLPHGSIFRNWADARRYAGPLPYTFDVEPQTGRVVVIKGVRGAWRPRPVAVEVVYNGFTQAPPLHNRATLCSAFHVADVDYTWLRGELHNPWQEAA